MELNQNQRERLRELIKEKYRTQVLFAEKAGYTQQYVNYIINGSRKPTLETIRNFACTLEVTEDYLLCKTDFRSKDEKNWYLALRSVENEKNLDAATNILLSYADYKICGEYASNFEELKKAVVGNQFETVQQIVDTLINGEIEEPAFNAADTLYDSFNIMIEIETPTGKKIAADRDAYLLTIRSIEQYAKFAMENLEHCSIMSKRDATNGVDGDLLTNLAKYV